VTATPILEYLAKEFSSTPENIRSLLELLDAGLSAPYIGRVRRQETGGMSESVVRRIDRLRKELEELDRRRGTILRLVDSIEGVDAAVRETIERCMDRFELEDLFVPHRRPEPEVQLALDRGLGDLANRMIAEVSNPSGEAAHVPQPAADEAGAGSSGSSGSSDAGADAGAAAAAADDGTSAAPAVGADAPATPAVSDSPEARPSEDAGATPAAAEQAERAGAEQAPSPEAPQADAPADPPAGSEGGTTESAPANAGVVEAEVAAVSAKVKLTPQLARLCAPFVDPNKGVHSEEEALSGAMRVLSDRLGRDAALRGLLRRMLRKHGVLSVRPTVDEGKLGRHRSLLRLKQPLKQVQGHRLLAIRQAQKERVLNAVIELDHGRSFPRVRSALGKRTDPDFGDVLDAVAERALQRRLLPIVEEDVRLELKERGDEEALRLLSQHLRQVFLAPPGGRHPTAGLDVNAKNDWTIACVDADGRAIAPGPEPAPTAAEVAPAPAPTPSPTPVEATTEAPTSETPGGATEAPADAAGQAEQQATPPPPPPPDPVTAWGGRIVTAGKDDAALGAELARVLARTPVHVIAVGHGKGARATVAKVRAAAAAAGLDLAVTVVNEAGLSSYANSELARKELADFPVPARMAISLARRYQDPLLEMIKVDPRHLRLGSEQGLVSKANLRRAFREVIESCAAHVGCDVNRAPVSFLRHLPGLDADVARRIVEARRSRPFTNREELRAEGLLSEAQWKSAVSFLRVPGSTEPLDATGLHPDQYGLARRIVEASGSSLEEVLGRHGATKGLRRADFDVDEATWRDLTRELSHPGRDPRLRGFLPRLLPADADPKELEKDTVVEGVVFNVASFGAFVDLGLAKDGMIHISEISDRYVRDARELLAIGQPVRCRVLDASGQRIALSLKRVPYRSSDRGRSRGGRRDGGGRGGGRGRREGGSFGQSGRDSSRMVRAAQTRRDGLAGASSGSSRRGGPGGRGGGPGGGRGGGARGRGRQRDDEGYDREYVKKAGAQAAPYNPFATFFKKDRGATEQGDERAEQPES